MPRKPTVPRVPCERCGKPFPFYQPKNGKPSNLRFCSRRCRDGGDTTEERFWSHVRKTDGCWLFENGHAWYGTFSGIKSHRMAWELAYGPIPPGMHVLHRCDNPPCVRPDHLWLGTRSDNMKDAMRKGRMKNTFEVGSNPNYRDGVYIGRWRNHSKAT